MVIMVVSLKIQLLNPRCHDRRFSQESIDKTCLPARGASTNVPRAFVGRWRV